MKTLADINALLGPEAAAELTQTIADIKTAVRSSDAGVIAEKEAVIAKLQEDAASAKADAEAALKAATDKAAADVAALQKAMLDASLSAKLAAENAASALAAMTVDRDSAVTAFITLRATLVQMANAQREALKSAATAIGEATAINTQALADDDAEKQAQKKVAAQKALEEAKAAAQAAGLQIT